jgi:hypothetical protein
MREMRVAETGKIPLSLPFVVDLLVIVSLLMNFYGL